MRVRNYQDWIEDDTRPMKSKKVKKPKMAEKAKDEWDDELQPRRKEKQKKWKSR